MSKLTAAPIDLLGYMPRPCRPLPSLKLNSHYSTGISSSILAFATAPGAGRSRANEGGSP